MINVPGFRKIILFLADLFLLYLALIITLFIRFGQNLSLEILYQHLWAFSWLFIIWLFVFFIFNFYELDLLKSELPLAAKIGWGLLVCLATGVIFFYLVPPFGLTPKTNLLVLILVLWALLVLWRKGALYLFSYFFQNRAAIIGATKESQELASYFQKNPQLGYRLAEIIPFNKLSGLSAKVKQLRLNTLIVAKNLSSDEQLGKILYECLPLKINILDLAKAYEMAFKKIPIGFVNQSWFLENLGEGQKELYDRLKRIFDIFLAILCLITLSPFWLLAALFIKMEDKGPVFYSQERMGINMKKFRILKFRTMQTGADKIGPPWTDGKDDPRITKIGKILRYIHLDELPQMLNILKGDLSFVGPRPEGLKNINFLEKHIPYYHLRHLIKPGFTGWGQIGSGQISATTNMENINKKIKYDFEKVEYDLYYIKNRSPFLDLNILLKTLNYFSKKNRIAT